MYRSTSAKYLFFDLVTQLATYNNSSGPIVALILRLCPGAFLILASYPLIIIIVGLIIMDSD